MTYLFHKQSMHLERQVEINFFSTNIKKIGKDQIEREMSQIKFANALPEM